MLKPSTPRTPQFRTKPSLPRNSWAGRKDVVRGALVTAAVVLIATVVTVPLLATQLAVQRTSSSSTANFQAQLDLSYCQQLSETAQQHCRDYVEAEGGDKFIAATTWRQLNRATFDCSGIEVYCLNSDIQSKATGSGCRVLAEAAVCGAEGKVCQQGYCGGKSLLSSSSPSSTLSHSSSSSSNSPVHDTDLRVDAKKAFQGAKGLNGRSDEMEGVAEQLEAPGALQDLPAPSPATATAPATKPAAGPSVAQTSSLQVSPAANSSWPTAVGAIWPSNLGTRVPETFLATSHEWKRMTDYGGINRAAWAEIFKMLSPSPVLRIGGSSQDAMTEVPGPEVWAALRSLQAVSNCRYIIGLPLFQKDAVSMAKQIMKDSIKHLGSTLIGFELGNEPEFWPTGLGGYDEAGFWQGGFEPYAAYFHRVASELNPCAAGKPILSGPGWGNVNTQDPSWFEKVVGQGKCYLWEANTHFYPYINNETVTANELLSQWLQDFGLDKFKGYAKIAKAAGLDIRISETNSLYGGGRVGLSDTLAGAFWVADALFMFANAGARAFHLHWGKGGEPNGNSQPNTGVQTNFEWKVPPGQPPIPYPSVHAPWYGYLFWITASAGGYGKLADTSFVPANVEKWDACTANIKIHALRSPTEVRIALLNKDTEKSCNMDLLLEDKFCTDQATLSWLLPGNKGMSSKYGITWQGQHYLDAGTTGKIGGTREVKPVPLRRFEGGKCGYTVAMPATTGALLVLKPTNPGQMT